MAQMDLKQDALTAPSRKGLVTRGRKRLINPMDLSDSFVSAVDSPCPSLVYLLRDKRQEGACPTVISEI